MRAVLFLSFLFSFFFKGEYDAYAAQPQQIIDWIQTQQVTPNQYADITHSNHDSTFFEDDIDTTEDHFSDNTKDKLTGKILIGKSPLEKQLSVYPTVVTYRKPARVFTYFHTSTQPIYLIHRVFRI